MRDSKITYESINTDKYDEALVLQNLESKMYCCGRCGKEIEMDSLFCRFCGKRQTVLPKSKKLKRANGTGSITRLQGHRRKPWVVRVYVQSENGVKKRITYGTYVTRAEAELALERANRHECLSALHGVTVEEAYGLFREAHFPLLGEKGRQSYEIAWRYLMPLAKQKLSQIKTQQLQCILNDATERGKSYSTVSKISLLASKLCEWGVQNDVMDKNYASFLVIGAKKAPAKERFSDEELEKMWSAYRREGDLRYGVILLLCYTGLRLDEFLSMKKSDYFDGCLHGGNKTEKGRNRVIPVADAIVPILERLLKSEGEYLYPSATGGKFHADNFRKRIYYEALASMGYSEQERHRRNPHTCRHTFASICARRGVDPKALQDIIGHTRIETTLNTYTHTDAEWLKAAIKDL